MFGIETETAFHSFQGRMRFHSPDIFRVGCRSAAGRVKISRENFSVVREDLPVRGVNSTAGAHFLRGMPSVNLAQHIFGKDKTVLLIFNRLEQGKRARGHGLRFQRFRRPGRTGFTGQNAFQIILNRNFIDRGK